MFAELGDTLKAMLVDAADPNTPPRLQSAGVSFLTPDKNFPPQMHLKPLVNLFLHEVKENRELRDAFPSVDRLAGGRMTFTRAPLRVICSYLVTTWADGNTDDAVQTGHNLLADAFFRFSQYPTLPQRYLTGTAFGDAQPLSLPPPSMIAQMDGNKVFGEFWTALGVPPRPAFMLLVTIAMPFKAMLDVPPVTTILTNYQSMPANAASRSLTASAVPESMITVAGIVRDALGNPVAGATVRLTQVRPLPQGTWVRDTQTNDDGQFAFTRIARREDDTFTLQSWTSWQPPTEIKTVQVPAGDGQYELQIM